MRIEGELTVYYSVGLEVPDADIGPDEAEKMLEDAYADGELGVLEDHVWTAVTYPSNGKLVTVREVDR